MFFIGKSKWIEVALDWIGLQDRKAGMVADKQLSKWIHFLVLCRALSMIGRCKLLLPGNCDDIIIFRSNNTTSRGSYLA